MKIILYIKKIFFIIIFGIILNIEMSFISHIGTIRNVDMINILRSDEFRKMDWTKNNVDLNKDYNIKCKYIRDIILRNKDLQSILTSMYRNNIWERCVIDSVIKIYHVDKKYEDIINNIYNNCKYYPVAEVKSIRGTFDFDNTWNGVRSYGGNRRHEGTDIMYSENKRNIVPIVSMTNGIVIKKGWLELGGYRLYIKVNEKLYVYYAHLASYADDIKEGQKIYAGQLLGYMGDSGYGVEGTTGKFDVHLHLGIYYRDRGRDVAINPYYLLKKLEKGKLCYK